MIKNKDKLEPPIKTSACDKNKQANISYSLQRNLPAKFTTSCQSDKLCKKSIIVHTSV